MLTRDLLESELKSLASTLSKRIQQRTGKSSKLLGEKMQVTDMLTPDGRDRKFPSQIAALENTMLSGLMDWCIPRTIFQNQQKYNNELIWISTSTELKSKGILDEIMQFHIQNWVPKEVLGDPSNWSLEDLRKLGRFILDDDLRKLLMQKAPSQQVEINTLIRSRMPLRRPRLSFDRFFGGLRDNQWTPHELCILSLIDSLKTLPLHKKRLPSGFDRRERNLPFGWLSLPRPQRIMFCLASAKSINSLKKKNQTSHDTPSLLILAYMELMDMHYYPEPALIKKKTLQDHSFQLQDESWTQYLKRRKIWIAQMKHIGFQTEIGDTDHLGLPLLNTDWWEPDADQDDMVPNPLRVNEINWLFKFLGYQRLSPNRLGLSEQEIDKLMKLKPMPCVLVKEISEQQNEEVNNRSVSFQVRSLINQNISVKKYKKDPHRVVKEILSSLSSESKSSPYFSSLISDTMFDIYQNWTTFSSSPIPSPSSVWMKNGMLPRLRPTKLEDPNVNDSKSISLEKAQQLDFDEDGKGFQWVKEPQWMKGTSSTTIDEVFPYPLKTLSGQFIKSPFQESNDWSIKDLAESFLEYEWKEKEKREKEKNFVGKNKKEEKKKGKEEKKRGTHGKEGKEEKKIPFNLLEWKNNSCFVEAAILPIVMSDVVFNSITQEKGEDNDIIKELTKIRQFIFDKNPQSNKSKTLDKLRTILKDKGLSEVCKNKAQAVSNVIDLINEKVLKNTPYMWQFAKPGIATPETQGALYRIPGHYVPIVRWNNKIWVIDSFIDWNNKNKGQSNAPVTIMKNITIPQPLKKNNEAFVLIPKTQQAYIMTYLEKTALENTIRAQEEKLSEKSGKEKKQYKTMIQENKKKLEKLKQRIKEIINKQKEATLRSLINKNDASKPN